jgi:Fe-S cluster assembly iron-binding protein IscA
MPLRDPVSVYIPANNAEAPLLCNLLNEEGIEAFAMEDVSQAGVASLGLLPGLHKPQIFVERHMTAAARAVLKNYEQEMTQGESEKSAKHFCYQCGEPLAQSAVTCPACGKKLDWSEETGEGNDEHDKRQNSRPRASGGMDKLRTLRRPIAYLLLSPLILMFGALLLVLVASVVDGCGRRSPRYAAPPSAKVNRRAVVKLTPAAITKLRGAKPGDLGYVRISIDENNAPNYAYDIRFDNRLVVDSDYLDEIDGLSILIDRRSAQFLEGTTIDWQATPESEGFLFDNPNAAQ